MGREITSGVCVCGCVCVCVCVYKEDKKISTEKVDIKTEYSYTQT